MSTYGTRCRGRRKVQVAASVQSLAKLVPTTITPSNSLDWRLNPLSFVLIAYSYVVLTQQVIFPGTLEVDLVFPRNDTYSPAPFFPFVFAIQNPRLAASLVFSIDFVLFSVETTDGSKSSEAITGKVKLPNYNHSTSEPYFTYLFTEQLNTIEGTWSLAWSVGSANCSDPPPFWDGIFHPVTFRNSDKALRFTTKKGAKLPDLVAAMDQDTCGANTQSHVYNVTGIRSAPFRVEPQFDGDYFDYNHSCAILSSTSQPPAADPCGAKIDASAASSISAALTATLCAWQDPRVTCPPDDNAAERFFGGTVWLVVSMGWAVFLLLL
ncbi:hypothetical protein QBC37DRAFT_483239 [Rhypophila decipiens]|uniref:DUF7136 domain-containing protein n=1 Tax=Rhypophila decipiens TaxID=261697 RepID=A0AAN7B7J1_9PEZI|nr:hypothetical protein QBC37DRAFT_483239 [Rhypophila decipiens]